MSEIKRKDIAENDLFGDLKKSAKEANAEVVVLSETLKVLVEKAKEVKGKVSTTSPKNLAELKKQNVLIKDTALLTKVWTDNQNALTKAKAKAKVTTDSFRKAQAELKVENQKLNKEAKLNAELTSKSVGAYRKAGIELARLKTKIKDATIAEGENSKTVKRLQVDYEKLNKKVRGADKSVGDFGRNVGNYPSKLKGAIGSLKNFAGSLGLVAGVAGAFRVLKDTVKTFREFEQSNANLGAILGATNDEMTALIDNSKRLGATTAFTASQVSELATEYAKLGFSTQEILNVTDATLSLAQATGTDLAQTATQVGSTLRAYGLDATKAGRVTDIFAKAASSSALDMQKLGVALPIVGTTSKIAGVSLERTTALLGTLSDRGLDASTSATSLRNVYLELSKQGLTWDEAMGKINESTDKNGTALQLFGKRGATTAVILAENAESTDKLSEALFNAGGTAKEMADKQLDTLSGAVKLLTSAWESLVLEFYDGNGALNGLKKILVFVAENLKTIFSVIGIVTKSFIAYKTAILASTVATKAYAFIQAVATKGMKAFNKASKSNIIGAIAVALVLAYEAFKKFNEQLSTSEKIQNNLLDVNKQAEKSIISQQTELKILTDTAKDNNLTLEEREAAVKKINEISPTYLGNITLENIATEEGQKALQAYNEELVAQARNKAILSKIDEIESKKIDVRTKKLLDDATDLEKAKITAATLRGDDDAIKAVFDEIIKRRIEEIKELNKETDALLGLRTKTSEEDLISGGTGGDSGSGGSKSTSEKKKSFSLQELEDELDAEEEIRTDKVIKLEGKLFKIEQEALKKKKKEEEKAQKEAEKQGEEDIKRQIELIKKQGELEAKALKEEEERKKKIRQEALETREAIVEGFTDKFLSDADKRIAKIDEEINKSEEQANRLQALADSGNIKAEQSLAEQNNLIAEAEAEKAKIEQQKQNIQLISGVILAYNSALQNGATPQEALKESFLGTASIQGFISALSIPTFFDGTDNTGAQGQGLDGRGGFTAMLHPHERVIPKSDNDLIGDYTNNEIAKVMQQHRLGTLTQGVNIVTSTVNDNSDITNKLDTVTEAIKNIPQNNIELGQITQGYMMLNQRKTKGKTTTTSRFKVN